MYAGIQGLCFYVKTMSALTIDFSYPYKGIRKGPQRVSSLLISASDCKKHEQSDSSPKMKLKRLQNVQVISADSSMLANPSGIKPGADLQSGGCPSAVEPLQ